MRIDAAVAVVVVNHEGAADLPLCVRAFRDQDHPTVEVIVVDNASRDRSLALLETLAADPARHPLRVIANPTNRGYAGGANDGIAASGAPVVAVVNPDVVPRPDFLSRAVAALAADDRRAAIQGKLLRSRPAPDGSAVLDTTGHVPLRTRIVTNRGEAQRDDGRYDQAGPVFGVSGALAVYRRSALEDVVLADPAGAGQVFDEDLFAFHEDVQLDWRLALRGWEAWYEPAAVAVHERGGAGPRRTPFVERLNWRNWLLVLAVCDDRATRRPDLGGVAAVLALKTGELLVTHPMALVQALRDLVVLLPRARERGRVVRRTATVAPSEVVARWFEPFAWSDWVRGWWRRVRGVPPGA